ncbi:MAG: glycoside hydrolase [Anaerolineae bacterium]|nr:glycoside hydrolase [Anaerolineae bacterium]
MTRKEPVRISRRTLLKGGITLLTTSILTRFAPIYQPFLQAAIQADRKRIYIAPDDHTDYLWTAGEAEYEQAFLEMLDYYLDQADATAGNSSDFQSRWNCDGSLWVWTYEKNRTSEQFQRLIDRVKDGHISLPLNALVVCLGGAPAEAVLRGMYYAGQIERRYNLRVPIAVAMENQTLPYGLAALWAGSGAKYSWKGICNCATRVPAAGDREHDIYWMQGPDSSQILMKWNSMLYSNEGMGGYAEARYPAAVVEYVDTDPSFIARYPYRVIGAFGQGWDDFKTMDQSFIAAAQNKTNSNRRVIVSNQQDFFEDFESTYGTEIPFQTCTFGNEWDLYCASMAEVSACVKRSTEKLRAAEALATLVNLQQAGFMDGRQVARDQAWMDLGVYWEHNWTADGPVNRATRRDWQRRLANEIEGYVDVLYDDAVSALGGMIQKNGTNLRFYAFNPLSWTRTDVADIAYPGPGPVHVIDLNTGEETPSQLISLDGQQYLRVWAQDVPPVGYKVFEVQSGAGQSYTGGPDANATTGLIENSHYAVTVAPRGAITSLVDKTRDDREFAQSIGGYTINDLGPSSGTLTVENPGPVSVTLKAIGSAPLAHTTRITLVRNSDRLIIRNEITQNFGDTYTWAFGFALENPDVWHEEVGAVIRARLLANGGHYSPRNARYDWLTLNHFVDMNGNGDVGITLSNADCYFMKLGNSTASNLDTITPQISPLAGGQVDGPALGIFDQGGDTHFLQRFALQTHAATNLAAAMRFALEHQNPLVTGEVTGGSAYPETAYSLLTISNPDVLLWALKPADDGIEQGIVARVWNLAPSAANFSLTLTPGSIARAKHLTHVETPVADATVTDGVLTESLTAQQLKTFSLFLSGTNLLEAPTNVSASKGTYSDRVRVTWDGVTVATGYEVWRNTVADPGSATAIVSLLAETTYDDTLVVAGQVYYYWIKARNADQISALSVPASGWVSTPTMDYYAFLPVILRWLNPGK